jgi:hypothetical protein
MWQMRVFHCSKSMRARPEGRIQRPAIGEIRMTSSDDWKKTVRLNKLLGMWAAEKLAIMPSSDVRFTPKSGH